jgi:hypothetical protein
MEGSLNPYLQPTNSPVDTNNGGTPSYYFQNNNERNAINLTRIKNFSFSQGFGGTLILGGTANGNGVMLVKDSSGSTIITANNAGIEIDGGNILIKNSTGSTILDTTGIVSTANFANDEAFNGSSGLSTSSTSFQDIPGSTLTSLVLTRTTRVMFELMAYGYNNGAISSNLSDGVEVQIYDTSISSSVTNTIFSGKTQLMLLLSGRLQILP